VPSQSSAGTRATPVSGSIVTVFACSDPTTLVREKTWMLPFGTAIATGNSGMSVPTRTSVVWLE
jgi:hypothetical protein